MDNKILKIFNSSIKFKLALLRMLPLAFFVGLRLKSLSLDRCNVVVGYKWLNKNPFGSIFWAVLGIAAEMASGAIVMAHIYGHKPSIAMLVVGCSAVFHKKAVGEVTFSCADGKAIAQAIERSIATASAQQIHCTSEGVDANGNLVAVFTFVWSVKPRI